jgi:hypothetical protein
LDARLIVNLDLILVPVSRERDPQTQRDGQRRCHSEYDADQQGERLFGQTCANNQSERDSESD